MAVTPEKSEKAGAAPARIIMVGRTNAEYQTVQAAVDAANPGDTVVIQGGVYREHVIPPRGGEPGRPITVRAASNQIVLLMPANSLEGKPEPVSGYPNVYRRHFAQFAADVSSNHVGLWEAPTHLRMKRVYAISECELRLGSWYYDPASKALYLRSSGVAPAKDLVYMIENAKHAVFEVKHPYIFLEGLQMAFGVHGVLVEKADHVTIRNCRAYCNRSAGIFVSGDHHRIEANKVFHNNQYGIQLRHSVNHTRVLNNLAYYNGPNNGGLTDSSVPADISMYSVGVYNVFEGNIIDGLHQNAFRIKYGGNKANVVRHNVIKGFFDSAAPCIENNTLLVNGLGPRFGGYVNRVNPAVTSNPELIDPGGRQRRTNIIFPAIHKEDPRFADPAWRDFRLQAGSPYPGMGAYPGGSRVIFVDPVRGDDQHHGRSAEAAFKTLAHTLAVVNPGYTVYLLPGVYAEPLRLIIGGLDPSEPIRIRAHGQSPEVVLTGGVLIERADKNAVADADKPFALEGPAHIVLEGLTFKDKGIQVNNASDIRLVQCVLDVPGTAIALDGCERIGMDHITVAGKGPGITVRGSPGTTISRSLFAGAGPAIVCDTNSASNLQSYYNVYARPDWRLGERELTRMEDWQAAVAGEFGGRVAAVELQKAYALPMGSPLTFAADDFTFAGARPAPAADRLEIANLRAAGLAPESATLLWETPRGSTEAVVRVRGLDDDSDQTLTPVTTFQIWGEFFDMSFRTESFFTADRHMAVSGLKPGKRYEATVTVSGADGAARNSKTIGFTTPKDYAPPHTYYVAVTGRDTAEGTSPEQAWRTFKRAADAAGPGDHVQVLPGVYGETLRPRIAGTAERPIVFESSVPQGAVIDLMESLSVGIEALNVNHVHVRDFAISNGKFARGNTITLANGHGLRISSCHVRYPPGSTFANLKLAHSGLAAADAPDLMVDNNVFLCGAWGVGMGHCPGARVINNTILGEGNYGVVMVPDTTNETYVVKNNLFYRAVMGYKTGCALWMFNVRAKLESDYNLFYIPKGHKGTIGMLPDKEQVAPLAAWQNKTGFDRHSIEGQPTFVKPEEGDFRLTAESLGRRAAEDGGPIGIRVEAEKP